METVILSPSDSIQKALDSLSSPAVVKLKSGVYREKVEVKNDGVIISGEGENTVISYGDFARKLAGDGKEYGTFRTYTLCVTGNNVKLENLTVENPNSDPKEKGQCVALSVNAKSFSAENVTLKSTQDTLFLYPFPDDLVIRYKNLLPHRQLYNEGGAVHLFKNCTIYGTVDFIFGCAEAYFKDCKLISLNDGRDAGFVAAPAHSLAFERGFVFLNCDFVSEGADDNSVYLARPWRDFGKCEFINCKLGKHINANLFDKWNDTQRDKTARFLYYNLACDFEAKPVNWCKPIAEEQVNNIIKRYLLKYKEINK